MARLPWRQPPQLDREEPDQNDEQGEWGSRAHHTPMKPTVRRLKMRFSVQTRLRGHSEPKTHHGAAAAAAGNDGYCRGGCRNKNPRNEKPRCSAGASLDVLPGPSYGLGGAL